MSARIKYEIEGVKVPSLNSILDNCKIGGIGNLLYRANQAGLAGLQLKNAHEDTTNAGMLAYKIMDNVLNFKDLDIDIYSDQCLDRSDNAVRDFLKWKVENRIVDKVRNLSLVSESLYCWDSLDVFSSKDHFGVLIMLTLQNNIYPENLIKLAARAKLLEENALIAITKCYILRINNPKDADDPVTFNVHEYDDLSYPLEVFKKMRELHDMQDTLKTLV